MAIGRNEGARLVACLSSLQRLGLRVVYVDSGSTDASLQAARDLGAQIVELDLSVPFTAARARNAGFHALNPAPAFVQFIDGDCVLEPGWIEAGLQALTDHPDIGIVTGWRSEIYPDASIYNGMAQVEWHRPAGDIHACGGDMMVRADLFRQMNGFNPGIIAAEDDEFCIRVRKAGYRVHRLPVAMTRHDANILRFRQWWQRAVRTGHAYAQVGAIHPEHFHRERQRVWIYGAILPLLALLSPVLSWWLSLPLIGGYSISYIRTARGLHANGLPLGKALHQALFLCISKLPNLAGLLTYHWRSWRKQDINLIEYK
ncbi:glycosyltransferase [Tabrizicola sp. BL-A-41-H6]|uniref:glycosyltransferase n=1 Tax=Tabrizicola sp. BL-A-41-H6 TaxID=3421107 RepID=UPI003D67C976